MKKIDPWYDILDVGRARQHQQQRKHARTQQRHDPQPEPGPAQLAAMTGRHVKNVLFIHDDIVDPFEGITRA
jgi:hypothetical protein